MERLNLLGCQVSLARREVHRGDAVLVLSSMETELLRWLSARAGQPASREELLVEVWGFPKPVMTRAVDNTVMRLRQKIERDPQEPDHLRTVRGVGYVLELPLSPEPPPEVVLPPLQVQAQGVPTATAEGDDFFGRHAALAALTAACTASRLVTVVGPGGVGKTRLVAHWQALQQSAQRQGLGHGQGQEDWLWCGLSACQTGAEAVQVVAQGLGCAQWDASSVRRHLSERVRPLVLILDNAEQIAEDVAAMVQEWLSTGAAMVRLVVTSRERLQLRTEQLVELGPMLLSSARALFFHRARQLRPDFEAAEPEVDALLEGLDRLPLAIELAAARTRLLSVAQIRAGLADTARLLRGDRRDLPTRHRSITQTVQWSWDLLSPPLQTALSSVSLLADGFDLDMAEAFLDLGPEGPAPLDALAALRDRSLLVAVQGFGGDARLRVLEVIRQFAVARLEEHPEREAIEDRLLAWMCSCSGRWRQAVHGPSPEAAVAALAREQHNLLTLARRCRHRRPFEAATLLYNLGWHLLNRTPDPAALRLAVQAADAAGDAYLRVECRLLLGRALEWGGEPDEAEAHHAEALALAEALVPTSVPVAAFHLAAHLCRRQAHEEAEALCVRGIAAAADVPHLQKNIAMLYNRLASISISRDRYEEARLRFEETLRRYQATGWLTATAYPRFGIAECDRVAGRDAEAEAGFAAVYEHCCRYGIHRFALSAQVERAWLHLLGARPAAARDLLESIRDDLRATEDPSLIAYGDLTLLLALHLDAGGPPLDTARLEALAGRLRGAGNPRWAAVAQALAHAQAPSPSPSLSLSAPEDPSVVPLLRWLARLREPPEALAAALRAPAIPHPMDRIGRMLADAALRKTTLKTVDSP